MEKDKRSLLTKRILAYQERIKKLEQNDAIIKKRMNEHNKSYTELTGEYVRISLSDKKIKWSRNDCSRKAYDREIGSLNFQFARFSKYFADKTTPEFIKKLTRHYNYDVLNETRYRWNQVCIDRARISADRISITKTEYKVFIDYERKYDFKEDIKKEVWQRTQDTYFRKHNKLVGILEDLLSEDEMLQKELEELLELRIKIYNTDKEIMGHL